MFRNRKRKEKKQKSNIVFRIIAFIQLLVSLAFSGVLIYINILPFKYLIIVLGLVFIFDLIFIFILTKRKSKKKLKIITSILSLLTSIILGVLSFYIMQTAGLLNNMNLNYKTYNYSVIVLKDGNYDVLKDLKGKEMGYFKNDNESMEKSLNKINSLVKVNLVDYTDLDKIGNALLDGETDAILLENSYMNMLNENEDGSLNVTNFKDKTKVIYTFSIKVKTSDINKKVKVTKEPFNVYISGIDTYGTISSVSRSDVNIVMTVNPKTKQILLTSIPRDYYVQLAGTTGSKDKLTHAGMYGVEKSIATIEDLLGIDINYYFKVNFSSVIEIINAIKGVDVYSDYTFTSKDGFNYQKGYNSVDGEEALSFVRERYAFSEGDRQRGKNQQAMIEAILRKCTSPSIITKYSSLLKSIDGSFVTNMSSNEITSLVKMQLKKNVSWTITSNSLDGKDSSNYAYSCGNQKLYVMEPIQDSIDKASKLINKVMNGEKLEGSYGGDSSNSHSVTKSSVSSGSSNLDNSSSTSEPKPSTSTTTPTVTYKVTAHYYLKDTTTKIIDDAVVKEKLSAGATGNYTCPNINNYIIETDIVPYKIIKTDTALACYYSKVEEEQIETPVEEVPEDQPKDNNE